MLDGARRHDLDRLVLHQLLQHGGVGVAERPGLGQDFRRDLDERGRLALVGEPQREFATDEPAADDHRFVVGRLVAVQHLLGGIDVGLVGERQHLRLRAGRQDQDVGHGAGDQVLASPRC